MGKKVEQDLSSFMAVLIMVIGCLMVILVTNVIIIISNPENTRITSVIRSALWGADQGEEDKLQPFPHGNRLKEPSYVDVRRDRLIIYPGEQIVPVRDLENEGNAFEKLLTAVAEQSAEQYIVLLIRPRSAVVARRLQKAIKARGIDLGWELFEDEREVDYSKAVEESGVER